MKKFMGLLIALSMVFSSGVYAFGANFSYTCPLSLEYGWVENLGKGYFLAEGKRDGISKSSSSTRPVYIIDSSGEVVKEYEGEYSIDALSNGNLIIGKNEDGKRFEGVITPLGDEVIPMAYNDIIGYSEGFYGVEEKLGQGEYIYYFVDENGKRISDKNYEDIKLFSEGLAAVKTGGKWGYIDTKGKMVITPKFFNVENFCEGIAAVSTDRLIKTYIDKSGNSLRTPEEILLSSFYNGQAFMYDRNSKTLYVIDKDMNILKEKYFEEIPYYREYSDDKFMGVFKTETIVDIESEDEYEDHKHVIKFYGSDGEEIDYSLYERAVNYSEGLSAVPDKDYNVGYVDAKGNEVVPFIFLGGEEFKDGYAVVEDENYFGIIKINGNFKEETVLTGSNLHTENMLKNIMGILLNK